MKRSGATNLKLPQKKKKKKLKTNTDEAIFMKKEKNVAEMDDISIKQHFNYLFI